MGRTREGRADRTIPWVYVYNGGGPYDGAILPRPRLNGTRELYPCEGDGYFVGFHVYEPACIDEHERYVEMLYLGEVWGPPDTEPF